MKQIILIALAFWLGLTVAVAQEVTVDTVAVPAGQVVVTTHDIRGVATDRKQQPIVGALVRVEGTDISTVTDVDGKFLLRDVPVDAGKILVESVGMETATWDIDTPIQVTPRRRKLSFVVSAGAVMSRYTYNGGSFKAGYEIGVGIEVRRSAHWAFRPMLQFTSRGTIYESDASHYTFKESWNPMMLDLPLYFVNRHKLAYKTNLVFSFGPVLSWGLGGKVTSEYNGIKSEYDIYKSKYAYEYYEETHSLLHPFSFGAAYSLGVEYKQLTVGVWGKNMAVTTDDEGLSLSTGEHNWSLMFGAAYRF